MKLSLLLGFLIILLSIGYVSGVTQLQMEMNGLPEWEKYILDEEANKDKLFCRTIEDNSGNVIETIWYNSFINPNEEIRRDVGDTTTPNCEWPQHEPIYAVGSNKGKVYSRKVFDEKGNVIETIWYDACSDEIIRTDDGDTTYQGSNEFSGECYHPDYATNNGEENEQVGEVIKDTPIVTLWNDIVSWVRNLFNM